MLHFPFGVGINKGDLYYSRTDLVSTSAGQSSIIMATPPYMGVVLVTRTEGGVIAGIDGTMLCVNPASRVLTGTVYDPVNKIVAIPSTGVGETYTVEFWSRKPPTAPALGSLNADAISLWPKLVAWYEHKETSGTVMTDSHSGGYNGTYGGGATVDEAALTSGTLGSILLSGSTAAASNCGSVPHASAFDTVGSDLCQTVLVNLQANSVATNSQWLVSRDSGGSGLATYALIWSDPAAGGNGKLVYRLTKGLTTYDNTSTATVSAGSVYLLGGQRISGTNSEIYINGVFDHSINTVPTGNLDNNTSNPTKVGAYDNFGDATTSAKGFFGSTMIWASSLTAAEHAYLWNGGNCVSYATFKAQSGH